MRALTVQRNISLAVVFFLLFLTSSLTLLLFKKTERVIVIPAVVEKEFWIDGSSVSPTYLEQIGCFIGDLLLIRSPASADMQLTILMRHTAPEFSINLSSKLAAELIKLKKEHTSYIFFRTGILVEMERTSVVLEGDRSIFLGDKLISKVREKYRLGFKNDNGRLLLASIERIED